MKIVHKSWKKMVYQVLSTGEEPVSDKKGAPNSKLAGCHSILRNARGKNSFNWRSKYGISNNLCLSSHGQEGGGQLYQNWNSNLGFVSTHECLFIGYKFFLAFFFLEEDGI